MSVPRKHHYVPRFYLSGFGHDKDGRLYVLDKESGRTFVSNPNSTGSEKDFYTLEVDGDGDPLAIEKFFGKVEADGAEALRFIIDERAIPTGDLYAKLIQFLAIMSVRGPAVMDAFEKPVSQVLKTVLWYATSSKEAWDAFMKRGTKEGEQFKDVSYEQARDFVRSDQYTISMGQNFKMEMLVNMLRPAEPLIAARKWSVVLGADNAPDFICSDRPLTLCWTVPTPGPYGPALGLKGTTAMFPVTRRVALIGLFESIDVPRELNRLAVGVTNMYTAMYAKRFVYAGTNDFTVALRDGSLAGKDGFLKAVAPRPAMA